MKKSDPPSQSLCWIFQCAVFAVCSVSALQGLPVWCEIVSAAQKHPETIHITT